MENYCPQRHVNYHCRNDSAANDDAATYDDAAANDDATASDDATAHDDATANDATTTTSDGSVARYSGGFPILLWT